MAGDISVQNIDADTIAKLLVNEIIPRHGAPRTLLLDRGTNFLSHLGQGSLQIVLH